MADCSNIFSPADGGGTMTCAQLTSTLEELKVICNEVNNITNNDPITDFTLDDGSIQEQVLNQDTVTISQDPGLDGRVIPDRTIVVGWETPAPQGTNVEDYFYMYDDVANTFTWVSWSALIQGQQGFFKNFDISDDQGNNATVTDGQEVTFQGTSIGGIQPIVFSASRTVEIGFTNEPDPNGAANQIYVFNSGTDAFTWVDATTIGAGGANYYERFDVAANTNVFTVTVNGGVLPADIGANLQVYQWPAGKKLLETDEYTVAGSNIQLAPSVVLITTATYEVFFTV